MNGRMIPQRKRRLRRIREAERKLEDALCDLFPVHREKLSPIALERRKESFRALYYLVRLAKESP